jgi:hypothetical protein
MTFACAVVAAALMLPAQSAAQDPQTPPSQPPAQQQPATPQQQPPAGDEQAARQRLTDARNTLSEMTQLPAASQLTGDARTQISQLISNFNELISAESDWKASYDKVTANLSILLGPENVEPAPPATGTPGAVGTSGTIQLDPAVREKLVELRLQLKEFEKAATGGVTSDPAASATPTPMTTPPSTTPPSTTPPSTTPPSTTPPSGTPETTPTTEAPGQAAGNAEIARHIAAIEAMLKSEDDSGGITLTKAQLEQLRTHWAALKASIR